MALVLQEKLKLVEKYPNNVNALSSLLKVIRKEKIRRPDIVNKYGKVLLEKYSHSVQDVWTIYEQVFLSALDYNDPDLAKLCLKALQVKFPSSSRVQRLEGMGYEALGEYKKAETLYTSILEANPANALVMKRLACIHKAQGKTLEAIAKLNEYLSIFQTDHSAWQELADLYLSINNYRCAAFCYEDLVLINPMNFHYHCRLAEIYFTLGGYEKLKIARKHFSLSIELNKINNTRAYLGIMMCGHAISLSKPPKEDIDINSRIYEFSSKKVTDMYRTHANQDLADIMLDALEPQRTFMQC